MLTAAERAEMLLTISDLTKEAFGFRIRKDYGAMTDAELKDEWDYLISVAERRAEEERTEEAAALKVWNTRINNMVNDFGIDVATAVRWDMQAMDCEFGGFDYYIWECGVNYSEGRKIGIEVGLWKEAA